MERRSKIEMMRRYFVCTVGLFIMAFGVSLVTRSLMGTSPISSAPYVWSLNTDLSMGTYIIILNAILIGIQMLMLGKDGIKENKLDLLLQIPVSLLFGVFVDVTMSILSSWHPDAYWIQLLSCIVGCVVTGLGVSLEVVADVCMNSGEYVVQIASKKFRKEFGTVKILFDVTLLLIAVGCSWILAGKIDGVREGTIIVAVLTGPVVRLIRPRLRFIEAWEEAPTRQTGASLQKAVRTIGNDNRVITVSREYGSGGHDIGKRIAEKLKLPFYDEEMLEMVSKESGFSEEIVRQYDQRLPHSLLYEMIVSERPLDPERTLTKNDALFIVQSRIIRRLASEEPCVIVGRCADFVLRDYKETINVFIRASLEYKSRRAISRYGLSEEIAATEVERIDSVRRDHYSYYTGRSWGAPENYDAVFDTSRLRDDAIVAAVVSIFNCRNI